MSDEQRPPASPDSTDPSVPDAEEQRDTDPGNGEEPPAPAAPPVAEGRKGPAQWPLWLVLLLLAVAGGGGGYFLYHATETARSDLAADLAETRSAVDGLSEALEQAREEARTAEERAGEAAAAQSGFSERLAGMDERLAGMDEQIDGFASRQEGIADGLERLGALADAHEETWIRSEAGYLTQVATHRVRFHRDIDSALAALEGADELLTRLGGRGIGSRQAVGEAIDALLDYSPPNMSRIGNRLDSLAAAVDDWKLRAERRDAEEVEMPWTGADEGWRGLADRAWLRLREGLGALVTIHREDEVVPYIPPEKRYFLRESLRLQLEGARLALILRDEEMYRMSLERAGEWLAHHFDMEDAEVNEARTALQELAATSIVAQPPDIGPILEPLKPF